jgi:hypothetical protein
MPVEGLWLPAYGLLERILTSKIDEKILKFCFK